MAVVELSVVATRAAAMSLLAAASLVSQLAAAQSTQSSTQSAAQASTQASTQPTAMSRAMDYEGRSRFREAAAEYRVALADGDAFQMALLGYERSMHEIGALDELLAVADSIAARRPAEPTVRTIQMRAQLTLGRTAQMRGVFEAWRAAVPRDAAPYREYARMLIDGGRMQTADTVLKEAERAMGNNRVLSLELAQVRSALGFWPEAALAWRNAVEDADYLAHAAINGLSRAPAEKREILRSTLIQQPANVAVRRVLATLELNWGSAQLAWNALADLPATDSSRSAWLDFADRAEAAEAWLPARDALVAALGAGGNPELASRAASASVSGGDPQAALGLIARESQPMQQRDAARWFGVVHVRALAALGRAADAEAAAGTHARLADENVRRQLRHEVAWAWVRAGDIGRARQTLAEGSGSSELGEIGGWLALYSGDLRGARTQLRGYGDAGRFPGTVLAMSILGRARTESSVSVGSAFLSLARGDSARAAQAFRQAAGEVPEAASLLLATAARLTLARDTAASLALWQRIVSEFADSPEAAEADLEWARLLRRRGDRDGAIKRYEHLILTFPSSALLPQARRELDAVKATILPAIQGQL
jgi:tetratricopeptide (TPR) repeat protein